MTGTSQAKSNPPVFSVIIPVFNCEQYIRKTIESILSQTFRSFELILLDDGSVDSTHAIISEYEQQCTVLTRPNRGPGFARNEAVSHARGEYLVFLDHDDVLMPFTLRYYNEAITNFDRPPLLLGKLQPFRNETELASLKTYSGPIEVSVNRDYLAKRETVGHSNSIIVVKRDVFDSVGGYSTETFPHDDYDLLLKVGECGPCIIFQLPKTVGYRCHANNYHRQNLTHLTTSLLALATAERDGRYPGKARRAIDRFSIIGGQAVTCIKYSWKGRQFAPILQIGLRLSPHIAAGVMRKIATRFLMRLQPIRKARFRVEGE